MTEPKRVHDELVEFVAKALWIANDKGIWEECVGEVLPSFYEPDAKTAVEAIQKWDAMEVKNVEIIQTMAM